MWDSHEVGDQVLRGSRDSEQVLHGVPRGLLNGILLRKKESVKRRKSKEHCLVSQNTKTKW